MSIEYTWNSDAGEEGEPDGEPIVETVEEPPEREDVSGLLPEEFWDARPAFGHIRKAAHARIGSGDVLFWATLARLSGMLSHHIRAETGIGTRASLNIFVAAVGKSGTGKSSGAALARGLMPTPSGFDFWDGIPPGTGEGIAEAFIEAVQKDTGEVDAKGKKIYKMVREQVRHNAYIYVDEGATLTKLAARSGSTIEETLRSVAMGEMIGQSNASADRKRLVEAETYSLGMFVGYQPKTIEPLLADVGTGYPQRYFFTRTLDPSIPDVAPERPGPFAHHPGYKYRNQSTPIDILFPKWITDELQDYKRAVGRGEIEPDEINGHASIMKTKLAAMFALLDDREKVSDRDWELAGIAWNCSCTVRDSLIASAKRKAEEMREAAEKATVDLAIREHEAKSDADRRIVRIARKVLQHTVKAGLDGITRGGLRKCFSGDDKPYVNAAVDYAIARGWVHADDDDRKIFASAAGGEGGEIKGR